MKNKEKFEKEIFEIACSGGCIAVDKKTGNLTNCKFSLCHYCLFDTSDNCAMSRKYWCESEYVEQKQKIDWSKVPIDTPIWVRDCEEEEWVPRYFAKFEDGYVYAFNNGATSWSSDVDCSLNWRYAKLAEMEEYND